MKPRKPLKRKSWLRSSRRPIAPRRADPTKRAFAKRRVPAFQAFVREHQCVASGRRIPGGTLAMCLGHVECAHIKTRGSGGDDLGNCLALCSAHHRTQHAIGWPAFEAKYGIDAKQIATVLTEQWLATDEGIRWRDAHPTNEEAE